MFPKRLKVSWLVLLVVVLAGVGRVSAEPAEVAPSTPQESVSDARGAGGAGVGGRGGAAAARSRDPFAGERPRLYPLGERFTHAEAVRRYLGALAAASPRVSVSHYARG